MAYWYFPKQSFQSTPSVKDGIRIEDETMMRIKGVNFIFNVGLRLKLPQIPVATAAVLLHRFYMRNSLKQWQFYEIGATCLFIATKLEESGRRLKDVIVACARVAQKNLALVIDEQSKEYWRWRDSILYREEIVLESLCFDLTLEHPYAEVITLFRRFAPNHRDIARTSWAIINDSLRSTLCVQVQPRTIAAFAFYLAMKRNGVPIAETGRNPWHVAIDCDMAMIDECVRVSQATYAVSAPKNGPPGDNIGNHGEPVNTGKRTLTMDNGRTADTNSSPSQTEKRIKTGQ